MNNQKNQKKNKTKRRIILNQKKYYLYFKRREKNLQTKGQFDQTLKQYKSKSFKEPSIFPPKDKIQQQILLYFYSQIQQLTLSKYFFRTSLIILSRVKQRTQIKQYFQQLHLHNPSNLSQPTLSMEDETQYFQQHEKLRKQQFKQESSASSIIFENEVEDQKGSLKLIKKHRFPFKVTCFESVGQKIILGSNEGSLYAYQVLQTEQKQDFKLLYIEQNAHKKSHVSQLINCNQNKRNGNNSNKQDQEEHLSNTQIKNLEKIDRNINKIDEEIYLSQADNQTQNHSPSPNITIKQRNLSNQNTNQFQESIISYGLYDRKVILWQILNKFEKKAESQVFKTYINHIATDDNFVFVATLKKVYALSLDTLTICMKFGIPNYESLDFLFSSIACISLKNSNILIAGTDCYNRNNYFISLWEYPKQEVLNLEQLNCNQKQITPQLNSQNFDNANQMNLEDNELNFDIDNGYKYEEQKENNDISQSNNTLQSSYQQTPEIINDIEDLDNFDIDGDFPDTSADRQSHQQQQSKQSNNKQNKSQRISFWQPTLIEFCHNSRIKQLKYNSNTQQLISVSLTEVNIWKISDETSEQQIQQNQTQLTQNIAYQISSNITSAKMSQNQLETFAQKSKAIQVFSLKLNNERNVNAVIEKHTNNILLFLDNDLLSFDSSNYKLNFQSNISSSNHELSHLYINPATQQHSIYPIIQNQNNHQITQTQPLSNSHNNHYLLIQNDQSQNQENQKKPKFFIAALEIEQSRNKSKQKYQISHSDLKQNKITQQSQQDTSFQRNQEKCDDIHCVKTISEDDDEKEIKSPQSQQSPSISQCKKTLMQSPINVPPAQKYSTAHIVPSTASYTVLMNQLKKIEQSNSILRQLNASSNLRRSSNSTSNCSTVQLRKPQACQIRSNSKCIKKQLKRCIKYSNKKKKQNLVKIFSNQNSTLAQNNQQKQINSESLTMIEEKSPPINNHQQRDFQIKQKKHNGYVNTQKQIHTNSQKQKSDNNRNNITNNKKDNHSNSQKNFNILNKVKSNNTINNINNSNKFQKTYLIALDSELSLGFYKLQ